jgi:uncharacterized protein YdaU (DUF1376 family)
MIPTFTTTKELVRHYKEVHERLRGPRSETVQGRRKLPWTTPQVELVNQPSLQEILNKVCVSHGISKQTVISKCRLPSTVKARKEYYYRAVMETGKTYTDIGITIDRDHSSVMHGAMDYCERKGLPFPRKGPIRMTIDSISINLDNHFVETAHLSAEEHGAYWLILLHMRKRGGALPNDTDLLRRIAKIPFERWGEVWGVLQRMLELGPDNMWRHPVLSIAYERAVYKSAQAKEAGRKGGLSKAKKAKAPAAIQDRIAFRRGPPEPSLASAKQTLKQLVSDRHRSSWFERQDELLERLTEAANGKVDRLHRDYKIVQPILDLLAVHQVDIDHDVLPAVSDLCASSAVAIAGWGSPKLRKRILERLEARTSAETYRSVAQHETPVDNVDWEWRIRRYKESGLWPAKFGPPPDKENCAAPPHLLAKYEFRVA